MLAAEYEWSEDTAVVHVTIPLKGASAAKMGVVTAPLLVKVNFSPFLLEIDLVHAIDDLKATARVRGGTLHLTLPKAEAATWGRIDVVVPAAVQAEGKRASKRWLRERRQRSLDAQTERNAQIEVDAAAKRIADSRNSVREQMATESRVMTKVDTIKSDQKQEAEDEVFRVFGALEQQEREARRRPPAPPAAATKTSAAARASAASCLAAAPRSATAGAASAEADIHYIPAPRARARIALSFTHRAFPTPKRESKREEEEEYLAKNAAYLRQRNPDARNIAEYHPMWLKGKGDDFYRRGDFESAISAYSRSVFISFVCTAYSFVCSSCLLILFAHTFLPAVLSALDADPTCLAALSNRAACRLQLRHFARALGDCSAALTALPAAPGSAGGASAIATLTLGASGAGAQGPRAQAKERKLRLRLLSRAGAACCGLGNFREGLRHLQQALALDSENVPLQMDVQRAARLAQCAALKLEGDRIYRGTDAPGAAAGVAAGAAADAAADAKARAALAVEKYGEALAIEPGFVAAVSNRAACYLALGGAENVEQCVAGCSAALALLDADEAQSVGAVPLGLPPPKSEERLVWRVKTLLRRGGAYARRRQLILAADDFDRALRLLPVAVPPLGLGGDVAAASSGDGGGGGGAAPKAIADVAAPTSTVAKAQPRAPRAPVSAFAGMREQITRDLERIHVAMRAASAKAAARARGTEDAP